jgi:hypothetical protein
MSSSTQTTQITGLGTHAAPLDYVVKDSQVIGLEAVTATFDGSAVGSGFQPCVQIITDSGHVLASCPAAAAAAGDVVEVTFAPFLRAAAAAVVGSGIQYDVHNSGGWLDVASTGFDPVSGDGIRLHATGDGNPLELLSEGGEFVNDVNGWGITLQSTAGTGGSADINAIAARDVTETAGRNMTLFAGSFLSVNASDTVDIAANGSGANALQLAATAGGIDVEVGSAKHLFIHGTGSLVVLDSSVLPAADPGVSGALWNSAGTLKVSP